MKNQTQTTTSPFLWGNVVAFLTGSLAFVVSAQPSQPPINNSAPATHQTAAGSEYSTPMLPEVVVTATRTKEEVQNISQSVTVLTQQDIERHQALTPNETLMEQPGILSVQAPAQGSPIIRGQIGNRVLYLWDGIPINNGAIFAGPNGYFNQIPVGAVDRMEVIRGPKTTAPRTSTPAIL